MYFMVQYDQINKWQYLSSYSFHILSTPKFIHLIFFNRSCDIRCLFSVFYLKCSFYGKKQYVFFPETIPSCNSAIKQLMQWHHKGFSVCIALNSSASTTVTRSCSNSSLSWPWNQSKRSMKPRESRYDLPPQAHTHAHTYSSHTSTLVYCVQSHGRRGCSESLLYACIKGYIFELLCEEACVLCHFYTQILLTSHSIIKSSLLKKACLWPHARSGPLLNSCHSADICFHDCVTNMEKSD